MSTDKKLDEDYEKPSRHRQWQERSSAPVAARPMTSAEIEEHRLNLVASYKCEDKDISFEFQKIIDENDEDRDDCLWLKYKMKCIVNSKPTIREIYSLKIPIPEEVRRMAEQLKKQQMARKPAALMAPVQTTPQTQPNTQTPQSNTQTPQTPTPTPAASDSDEHTRPKLRKPVLKK